MERTSLLFSSLPFLDNSTIFYSTPFYSLICFYLHLKRLPLLLVCINIILQFTHTNTEREAKHNGCCVQNSVTSGSHLTRNPKTNSSPLNTLLLFLFIFTFAFTFIFTSTSGNIRPSGPVKGFGIRDIEGG